MTRPTIAQRVRLALIALRADKITDHGPITRTADEVTAGFVYAPRQAGKNTEAERGVDEQLAAVVPETARRTAYKRALVALATTGLAPWQLTELAAFFARGSKTLLIGRASRRQALAEAAEFIRPASFYQAKPRKAAGDIARLQEWLAGQGVEVTG